MLFVASTAHAQPLTSPGPLTASHASLDDPAHCASCHVNNTPALSNTQCLACHQSLVAKGLHASALVKGKWCWTCHGDHRGRTFDDAGWRAVGGTQRFDHAALASWALHGKHAQAACTKCHTATTAGGLAKYTGLTTDCASCHAGPHGATTIACDRCHTDRVWKPAKATLDFDHDRDTKLPLVGTHRDVPCLKCHVNGAFPISTACIGCHAAPKHRSALFEQRPCEWCHAPAFKTFKAFAFDHDDKSQFPLAGAHRVPCVRCHTTSLGTTLPPDRCEGCHANPHAKRFAKIAGGCESCHAAVKWSVVTQFDHARVTKFALRFRHGDLTCRACHRGSGPTDFERLDQQVGCKECHAHTKVHADVDHPDGKFTTQQCTNCHMISEVSPTPRSQMIVVYHGPKSAFPLVKRHKDIPCADCHLERNARGRTVFDRLSIECGTCHQDTAHDSALGRACSKCHVSGTWDALVFDHQAPFPDGRSFVLDGEHLNVGCVGCHTTDTRFAGTPRTCNAVGCHAADDAHRGALGTACDRCHLPSGDNRFTHAMARFPLDGKHVGLPCDDCHPTLAFKPRPRECGGCHPEPRAHVGTYGTWCKRCHTTASWADRR